MITCFEVVVRCPKCSGSHADLSWHLTALESGIQNDLCQTEFNGKENAIDHVLLALPVNKAGKV